MIDKTIFVVYPKQANPKKLWEYDGSVESFITKTLAEAYAKKIGGFVSKQDADDEIYKEVKKAEKSFNLEEAGEL